MQWSWRRITALLLAGAAVIGWTAACAEPSRPVSEVDSAATRRALEQQAVDAAATNDALKGQVAGMQTALARSTGAAILTRQAATATMPPATKTPVIVETPTPTDAPLPTAILPPTPEPLPCNAAQVVEDVTIPPGTLLPPGVPFTKIWRVRNTGACAWTANYSLIFGGGDRLGGPDYVPLPGLVIPGQVIDLAVDLIAPTGEATYRGTWRLRDSTGLLFGDPSQSEALYTDVRVLASPYNYPFDFVAYSCLAVWSSGAGRLPCQGDLGDSQGGVRRVESPILENGYQDDEPGLLLQPQMITDGFVRGRFPPVRVEPGYVFSSVIGCARGMDACEVIFQLDYQIGSGQVLTLAAWREVYDEEFQLAEADLSSLAGNDVRFYLTVKAASSPHQDRALWLAPRIIRK